MPTLLLTNFNRRKLVGDEYKKPPSLSVPISPSINVADNIMPDAANYYYDMTALGHLTFFAELKSMKWKREELVHLLESVGLSGQERKKVGGFSFGMKKKLGIAQTLIGYPELIFLDEPTSGLDPESAVEIQELIRRLNEQGKTIFLTSHNLHEVEKLCSRISIMENGLISQYGTIGELKRKNKQGISISIQIKPVSPELAYKIKQELDFCLELSISGPTMMCTVSQEEQIPHIIFALARSEIQIYKVEPDQITLEDIFFGR